MIHYHNEGYQFVGKLLRLRGSVFPWAFFIAVPSALLCAMLYQLAEEGLMPKIEGTLEPAAWMAFSGLMGFLIIFRTSQAYGRFWEGCTLSHKMRAEWFQAASAFVAFTRTAPASDAEVYKFKGTLVRLISMLHAAALAEVEDGSSSKGIEDVAAFKLELLDAEGINEDFLETIRAEESRVEFIFHWIQEIVVMNLRSGVLDVPAPVLATALQDLDRGITTFYDALKVSTVPFPFPYAQTCDVLLIGHWWLCPVIIGQWATSAYWAAILCFVQVFTLWALNFIAVEIENPFGTDANDLDARAQQRDMNRMLLVILGPCAKTPCPPTLKENAVDLKNATHRQLAMSENSKSFADIWRQSENNRSIATTIVPALIETMRHGMRGSARSSVNSSTSLPPDDLPQEPFHSHQHRVSVTFSASLPQPQERPSQDHGDLTVVLDERTRSKDGVQQSPEVAVHPALAAEGLKGTDGTGKPASVIMCDTDASI